jgi:hypothetical protein
MHEGGRSRWAPHLVPRERLAERFGFTVSVEALTPPVDGAVDRGHVGFMGETEVVRQLAKSSFLNLFRPFPDLETVEVLARHVESHGFLGLQVKTCGWDAEHLENRVHLRRSSFRSSPSTYVCVLGWNRAGTFDDSCLLIPSDAVADLARIEGEWLVLELEPGAEHHRRLDEYRMHLAQLCATGSTSFLLDAVERLRPNAVLTDIRMPPSHHMPAAVRGPLRVLPRRRPGRPAQPRSWRVTW